MDPMVLVAIIEALIKVGTEVPALIQAGETAIALVRSGTPPTTDQQAQIDAGLDAAIARSQAS